MGPVGLLDPPAVSTALPVQPLTVNVLFAAVAVKFAIVIPLKLIDIPSVVVSDVSDSVKLAFLLAIKPSSCCFPPL